MVEGYLLKENVCCKRINDPKNIKKKKKINYTSMKTKQKKKSLTLVYQPSLCSQCYHFPRSHSKHTNTHIYFRFFFLPQTAANSMCCSAPFLFT